MPRKCSLVPKQSRAGSNNPNWRGGLSTNKACIDCGKPISKAAKRCGSCAKIGTTWKWTEKSKQNIRKEKNHQWRGGISIDNNGYIRCYLPEHPNSFGKGSIYQHRLVMEKHLGRYLESKEIVHHINGDRQNNKISNLMLFPTQTAHMQFKHLSKLTFICKHCGKSQTKDTLCTSFSTASSLSAIR